MNKKDFKRYMQQGLGRCAITLQASENIEKYKETVLWGCLHNLSYDTQCEGTRALYVYKLTTFFNDEDYFVLPTVSAFNSIPRRSYWLFSHFCELLRRFAENGNEMAKNALQQKYEQLFSILLLKKRRSNGYDFERDSFERLCVTLTSFGGIDSILKVASDMGLLFKENTCYDGSDFDWFSSSLDDGIGEKRLNALLRRESKASENILCFYKNYLKSIDDVRKVVNKSADVPSVDDIKNETMASGTLSPASRVRFFRGAEDGDKIRLAKEAIAEPNLDVKAELLSVFAFRDEGFPMSHDTIIEYSKLSHEKLREISLDILTSCQSQSVQEYALKLLTVDNYKSYAIKMLISNYKPKYKRLLLNELYKIKADYKDKSDWHGIGSKILDSYDSNVRLPKEFLIYVYNTTLCSFCRENAVRALAKHGWLTEDIIEECRYDSNCDISEYVNRYYPVKKCLSK